jgi:hypothetical protein
VYFKTRAVITALGISLLTACGGMNNMTPSGTAFAPTARLSNPIAEQTDFSAAALPSNLRLDITPEAQAAPVSPEAAKNAIANGGFETGKLKPWYSCGTKGVTGGNISTVNPYQGKYDAFSGNANTKTKETNGLAGVCQNVVVPKNPYLSIALLPVSNDLKNKKAAFFAYLFDATTGKSIAGFAYYPANATKWTVVKGALPAKDVSKYIGKKVLFFTGVQGTGAAKKYLGLYSDSASLTAK